MSTQAQSASIDAITDAARALKPNWKWILALGLITILVGCTAIALPFVATITLELLFGWVLLIGGIASFVKAVQSRSGGGFWLRLIGGLLYVAAGILLLVYPQQGILTLTALVALLFIIEGVFKFVSSFQLRPTPGWGWLCFSGVIAVILGAVIWSGLPGDAVWAMGLLVGINILFAGWSIVMFALAIRNA